MNARKMMMHLHTQLNAVPVELTHGVGAVSATVIVTSSMVKGMNLAARTTPTLTTQEAMRTPQTVTRIPRTATRIPQAVTRTPQAATRTPQAVMPMGSQNTVQQT